MPQQYLIFPRRQPDEDPSTLFSFLGSMPCHWSLSYLLEMTKDWDFEAPVKHGDGALLPSFLGDLMDTQKYNSCLFLWGYHCSFAMLSQYWKSFKSVFTKKIIIINKRPSGLSLGKKSHQRTQKVVLSVRGTRILWTHHLQEPTQEPGSWQTNP